jgi:hypothetical protein
VISQLGFRFPLTLQPVFGMKVHQSQKFGTDLRRRVGQECAGYVLWTAHQRL